jgi:hypothetical protein
VFCILREVSEELLELAEVCAQFHYTSLDRQEGNDLVVVP